MLDNPNEPNELDELLEWFDNDREIAVARLLELRQRMVWSFRFFTDPEALADEAIDRVLAKLRAGKIEKLKPPASYFSGVVRFLKLENSRQKRLFSFEEAAAMQGGRDVEPAAPDNSAEESEHRELLRAVMVCIEPLGDDGRLFIRYFAVPEDRSAFKHRERMAAENGLTIDNLRVKIHRIREKIIRCVKNK